MNNHDPPGKMTNQQTPSNSLAPCSEMTRMGTDIGMTGMVPSTGMNGMVPSTGINGMGSHAEMNGMVPSTLMNGMVPASANTNFTAGKLRDII